jgi:archaeosortase A (PGF-CTERM-specific)
MHRNIPCPLMSDLLILCAFLSFALFLAAREQKFAALAGWTCIVLNLWSEMPALFSEDNFLYPVLAILSLPFLLITGEGLLRKDPAILQLSRTAAIATIIYVPFAVISPLHDLAIAGVVTLAFGFISALGHHPVMVSWDVFSENVFSNQIILACTGITAIALMLGFAFGQKHLALRQAAQAFLLVVLPVFILNLGRVVVVFIAVSDQWFSLFPDPTGTGDANFFWAHNVIAEGLAIIFLLCLAGGLIRIIPELGVFCTNLVAVYRNRIAAWVKQVQERISG